MFLQWENVKKDGWIYVFIAFVLSGGFLIPSRTVQTSKKTQRLHMNNRYHNIGEERLKSTNHYHYISSNVSRHLLILPESGSDCCFQVVCLLLAFSESDSEICATIFSLSIRLHPLLIFLKFCCLLQWIQFLVVASISLVIGTADALNVVFSK